jgi:uncharacterized RDD family membrane protein YckC
MRKTLTPQTMEMKHAGFWIRFLAMLIDIVILGVIGWLIFGTESGFISITPDGMIQFSVSFMGWQTLVPIIYVLAFWIWKGATPGKMVLKLQIVEKDGKKLSWQKALLRYVGYIVSSVPLFLGFFWIGFTKEKLGFHDMIAKTYVVRK